MTFLRGLRLYVFLLLPGVVLETEGALKIFYVHDEHELPLAGVAGDDVLVRRGEEEIVAPEGGTWKLEGDLRENARLFRWTPAYGISRVGSGATDSTHPNVGHASMRHDPTPSERTTGALAEFLDDWPDGAPNGGVAIFVWLVDAQPTQIVVRPVPSSARVPFFIAATFKLTSDEARGQPAILLWRDGALAPPQPIFAQPDGADALVATLLDDADALRRLFKRGFKPDARGRHEVTLLHYAAEAGALDTLDALVAADRTLVSKANDDGTLPQHWAAADGRSAAVARLAAAGADFNRNRKSGHTPLIDAVRSGHLDTIRTLLAAGAAVDKTDSRGVGPVTYAMWSLRPETVELLLATGAADSELQNPVPDILVRAARAGAAGMVRWLLDHGADPNSEGQTGSPLIAAASAKDPGIAEALLAAGVEPGRASRDSLTPLMIAARNDNRAVAAALLDAGAPIDAMSTDGDTALHAAARANAAKTLVLLLEHGANRDARNRAGFTPFTVALLVDAKVAAGCLLARGAHIDPAQPDAGTQLCAAIRFDMVDVVSNALAHGWPVDAPACAGVTALRLAEACGSRECTKILRAAGADTLSRARIVPLRELDLPPSLVRPVMPDDPRDANERFPAQTVRVEIIVDADGTPRAAKILSGLTRWLNIPLLEALPKWRFTPGTAGGRAVATRLELPLQFPSSEERVLERWQIDEPARLKKPAPPFRASLPDGTLPKVDELVYRYTIDAQGKVADVEILQSAGATIDASVVATTKQLEFTPAKRGGKPVAVRITKRFSYKGGSP